MEEAQAASPSVRPWHPQHQEAQRDISDDEALMEFLMTKLPSMPDLLDLSDELLTLLRQKEVLTAKQVTSFQGSTSIKLKLMKFASYLSECKIHQFHGFVWATVNVGQPRVAAMLGLNISEYLDSDAPPSDVATVIPPPPPPTKAKLLTEWTVPESWPYAPRVAWHPAGHLLVTGGPGLYQLQYNPKTSQCTHTLLHGADYPIDISVCKDGSWVLTLSDSVVIHTGGQGTHRVPNISGEKCETAAMHDSGIYLGDRDNRTIVSCNRNLIKQKEYTMSKKLNHRTKHISVTPTGDLLVAIPFSNTVCIIDPHTGQQRFIKDKGQCKTLRHPWDACTHGGGQYILVAEYNGHCVRVYTYGGQFLHKLQVEGGVESPGFISVLDRQGQASLMAISTGNYPKYVIKIFSLR